MVKSMSFEDSPLASSPSHSAEEADHLVQNLDNSFYIGWETSVWGT